MPVHTLRDHLDLAQRALAVGPHPEKARLDAELLLLHLNRRNRAWLIAHPREELSAEQQVRYEELINRRLQGEPIQYITGEAEFYGLPFRVTRDVLIPRPETEHLVEKAIALAREFQRPRIVDVGTGSGAIAVALARHIADANVTAIDLSPDALALAEDNAARNAVGERIRFLEGDLLAPVASGKFDLVVSNPPYVAASDRETLSVEVRDFEPAMALFAGEHGLSVYERLIPAARAALVPGGFIVLEIGYNQSEAVRALLIAHGFEGIDLTPDLQSIPRVASARRGNIA